MRAGLWIMATGKHRCPGLRRCPQSLIYKVNRAVSERRLTLKKNQNACFSQGSTDDVLWVPQQGGSGSLSCLCLGFLMEVGVRELTLGFAYLYI